MTQLFCAGSNLLELQDMLNRELAKLCIWFEQIITELVKNQLYVKFRNRLPNLDINLCINNK